MILTRFMSPDGESGEPHDTGNATDPADKRVD
jgi:hypothetical protein